MISSVRIEADACEIAQPFPLKRTSATRPPSMRSAMLSSSPHSGFESAYVFVAPGSSPWFRGFL